MDAIITLTTDFGLTDAYVAAMKGVILGINPRAKLIDICHNIQPQNIHQAAFVLSTAYQFFPGKTVHLVVVDPGVGSGRRAIILRTPLADFVAPDNFSIPYKLKHYIDILVQPGYTFNYSPEAGYTGLVTGKPITVVYARGGQYPAGTDAEALDLQSKYMKLILGFIGFTDVRELMVEPTLMEGPDKAKQKKEEALNKAREMAKGF